MGGSPAFRFVLMMGVVNLFADTTYEGGASLNGPFLATLGASAAVVSIVAGVGEFLGYALRLGSGYAADRTGKHWPITFFGYAVNLLSVPAMALAPTWPVAAGCILAERIGRAIRKPTVEAMLSYATGTVGRGWVYAVNTALDETGATIGPLLMALVLFRGGGARTGYGWLLPSSLLALAALAAARVAFPLPARLEGTERTARASGFGRAYWLYMVAGACFAAGLMSFELISYHLANAGAVPPHWIPALLALATVVGIAASLGLGALYDRIGIAAVVVGVTLSALFAPLVFLGGLAMIVAGMLLWGIGYATQDTLLKALIAGVLPEGRRNVAFGLYYVGYGVGWLVGSIVTGLLYTRSLPALAAFSVAVQLASLPCFVAAARSERARPGRA